MQQTSLNLNASRKKQVAAPTVHDLNDKKMSELTADERKQVMEDWAVHFNDLDHRDGRFKFAPKGEYPARFHDKADAIKTFYAHNGPAVLYEGKRILLTRDK